ncbi:MAG: glucan ABC transporter ATP-binding protein/ permease [Acetobacteraceae bacterium]|nr:glucan ABC transporter ATP-binding protein/ permease [Acetobacteraceae bacterium]
MRFFSIYRRVLGLLGNDLRIAAMLTVANLIVAGLAFVDPVLFGRVVELLSRSASVPWRQLWNQALSILGLWAAVGATAIGANIAVALQAERMAHRNRVLAMSRFFEHVLNLPLSFHGDTHSGRLIKMMLTATDALFSLWLVFFREQLAAFLSALVLLPLTVFLNWRLSIVLIVMMVLFVTVTVIVIRRTEAGQREVETYSSSLASAAQDALANVMVVQSFTRLGAEKQRFGDIARQLIARQFPVLNWWAVVNVMTRAASTITVISIVVIGTMLHLRGQADVGEIVAFMGFAGLLISKMESAVSFTSRLFFQVPALEDFFAVLEAKSSVPEKPNAIALRTDRGEVVFDHVSFHYPGGPNILTDLSFVARPGASVALVGQTGAGKSTAMALLQRLWDPTEGRILIDGQDLRDVSLESLRRAIGVVFQESMLFNRSICDNLLIGRPDATREDIERACKLADAHEFIIRQPQGYDTMVGERGSTLSGGQRQRLAIARAALKDPPILIFDEATSALDAATEARVSRALKAVMAGRTTFIIAHRLSTVRDANEILVFDSGRIAEHGSFDALLAQGGKFAALVQTQLATAPMPRAAE